MDHITKSLLDIIKNHSNGVNLKQIEEMIDADFSRRSLQYKLSELVQSGHIKHEGRGRGAYYYYNEHSDNIFDGIPISPEGQQAYNYIQKDIKKRNPVGYVQSFLDDYTPNKTAYLSKDDIKFLNKVNENHIHLKDADTYSQNIMDRLLIDLSWNSSRLEGNTYSLLDTKRLIAFEKASGRSLLEAQMILNHKEAISFLIRNEHDIINRYTFLNVHALLSQNLYLIHLQQDGYGAFQLG